MLFGGGRYLFRGVPGVTLIQDAVSSQAQRNPDAVAVAFKDQVLTYGALDRQTNQLAAALKKAGCKKGDRVGLLLPKSISAIIGIVASLKAGCIYVPMDKASPAARLAKILDCCQPSCLLAVESTGKLLSATQSARQTASHVRIGWLDASLDVGQPGAFFREDILNMPSEALEGDTKPDDPAHILFTSGSTGTPKGVTITHNNVASFIKWAARYFAMSSSDHVSCHAPLHFDLSTFDIWGTFLVGAQLHLMPQEVTLLPNTMADFINHNQVTQWCSVPSALSYMAQFDAVPPKGFPSLRRVMWCGEVLPINTLRYWMKRLPDVRFSNLYGPTEATIASSFFTVPGSPGEDDKEVPIGTACEGESLWILNGDLNAVPRGFVGEIYIGGVGLSPGYWGDPEKTESAFIQHPEYGRIYKTGDLARMDEYGLVHFLGRVDSQIKSRGYRIELGEIESALHGLGLLTNCAVVALETDSFEGTTICCAYVPAAAANRSVPHLRRILAEVIPAYMLPSAWAECQSLPLNPNGKIDRPAVKDMFRRLRGSSAQAFAPPSLRDSESAGPADNRLMGARTLRQTDTTISKAAGSAD